MKKKTSNTERRTRNAEGNTPAVAPLAVVAPLAISDTRDVRALPVHFGLRETFTADSVTIEEPGSSMTHTREEVEGWLAGMNAARRRSDEEACREAVARTIRAAKPLPHGRGSVSLAAILVFLCLLGGRPAKGFEITPGYAFSDGQQLYAAQLEQLVQNATITPQFYNDQQTTPVLGSGYYFLILNPANQTYYRINAQQALYGNTNIFLNAPAEAVPAYGLLLFCDPTNGWVASTTVSNFLWNSASNINVAGLSFANTNNGGATNAYVLPRWPYPFSGLPPAGTNYPVHFLIFDTNGIPYREGLSNMELNVAFDLGTVFALPYEYEQEFAPWTLYGTNTTAPYTNAFGWATNFPITAYYQTNISGTNLPTLTDNDTIPINSRQQGVVGTGNGTNTSASLFSIYEYMTNKNALPPYTLARAQFSGITAVPACPGGTTITNMSNVTGIITNVALALNWTNPTPISFEGAAIMMPTTPAIYSNTVYWAEVTNAASSPATVPCFQLFTNFATAEARVSPILGNGVNNLNGATMWYVTNYTAVNCVVIQESLAASINTGVYGLWFTNLQPQNSLYYLTGSCQQQPGNAAPGLVGISYTQPPTTNNVNLLTSLGFGNTFSVGQFPLVQVLVQPQ